jgi:hypothetical protein
MSQFCDGRLIDMMGMLDPDLLEEDFLERDLGSRKILPWRKREGKKKLAVISGIAAGSVALTGVVVFLLKKHEMTGRAA